MRVRGEVGCARFECVVSGQGVHSSVGCALKVRLGWGGVPVMSAWS